MEGVDDSLLQLDWKKFCLVPLPHIFAIEECVSLARRYDAGARGEENNYTGFPSGAAFVTTGAADRDVQPWSRSATTSRFQEKGRVEERSKGYSGCEGRIRFFL